jgi:protein SCO1/2
MRKGIKVLVLMCILLTPAAVYVFLKAFGHNEFDLPFYSEEGKLETTSFSSNTDSDPKIFKFEELFDSTGKKVDQDSYANDIIILEFVSSQSDRKKRDFQIKRISDIFQAEESVRILRVFTDNNHSGSIQVKIVDQPERNISVLYTGDNEMTKMIKSIISADNNQGSGATYDIMLLLDNQQRIRGSYAIHDFEEIDRLILEVKILLKKKQHV